jgi:energy-coupling factor transporter transmembrane protein EcfT
MTESLRSAREWRSASWPGRGAHYRDTGSPLHRLGPGWKLLAAVTAAALAVASREPWILVALLFAVVGAYRVARLAAAELWQDTRWLAVQAAVIAVLAFVGRGPEGLAIGLRTGLQIALCFLPGVLVLRTTPTGRLFEGIQRWLPRRLAFAVAASLRFVPYFAREIHEIVGAQRLRGARLSPRRLWDPRSWKDWIECVAVPVAVRAIHTAQEAALAAEMRGIDDPGATSPGQVRDAAARGATS